MHPIQVVIVDDGDLFRQKTNTGLESAKDLRIVGVAYDHRQAISLIHTAHPDVLLMEIDSLEDPSSLLTTLTQFLSQSPHLKIIVLHEGGQKDLVLNAFKAGAMGHLVKDAAGPDEIVQAIRAVNRGDVVLNPRIAGSMVDEIISLQRRSS